MDNMSDLALMNASAAPEVVANAQSETSIGATATNPEVPAELDSELNSEAAGDSTEPVSGLEGAELTLNDKLSANIDIVLGFDSFCLAVKKKVLEYLQLNLTDFLEFKDNLEYVKSQESQLMGLPVVEFQINRGKLEPLLHAVAFSFVFDVSVDIHKLDSSDIQKHWEITRPFRSDVGSNRKVAILLAESRAHSLFYGESKVAGGLQVVLDGSTGFVVPQPQLDFAALGFAAINTNMIKPQSLVCVFEPASPELLQEVQASLTDRLTTLSRSAAVECKIGHLDVKTFSALCFADEDPYFVKQVVRVDKRPGVIMNLFAHRALTSSHYVARVEFPEAEEDVESAFVTLKAKSTLVISTPVHVASKPLLSTLETRGDLNARGQNYYSDNLSKSTFDNVAKSAIGSKRKGTGRRSQRSSKRLMTSETTFSSPEDEMESESLRQQVASLQRANDTLSSEVAKLKKAKAPKVNSAEMKQVKDKLKAANATIARLRSAAATAKDEVKELKAQVLQLQAQLRASPPTAPPPAAPATDVLLQIAALMKPDYSGLAAVVGAATGSASAAPVPSSSTNEIRMSISEVKALREAFR